MGQVFFLQGMGYVLEVNLFSQLVTTSSQKKKYISFVSCVEHLAKFKTKNYEAEEVAYNNFVQGCPDEGADLCQNLYFKFYKHDLTVSPSLFKHAT